MAPAKKEVVSRGRKAGTKSVPKALRIYKALQAGGYSFEDAGKIVDLLTEEGII